MNDKKNLNSNQMPEQVMGGIDQEQVDSMQGMNNMDPMQGMNNMNPMQGMNNMNSMQGMNNMNQMQGMNNMNQMQGMNNMDPMQGMNNMNSMQGMNNMNQMQGMNNMNQMQGMNNMNQMQGMNNMNSMQGMNNMDPMQGMNNMNQMQGMNNMNQMQGMNNMNQMQGMNNMNPMQGMNNMNPMQGMDGMNQVQVMDDMNQMPTQPQQNDFNEQTMQAYKARLRQLPEVQQLTGQIEVQNPNSIMHFGQKTSEGISKVSDELLHAMRVVKAEEANEMLVALTKIMDKFDVVELENVKSTKNTLASKLLKNVGNTVAKMFQKYDTMGYEIDKVYQLLKKYEVDIKEATVNLRKLASENERFYHELERYIVAGEIAIDELDTYIYQVSGNMSMPEEQRMMMIEKLNVCKEMLTQRVYDLQIAESVAMQAVPMINSMQLSNFNLQRKINSSFILTLPIFKQCLIQAIMLKRQEIQAKSIQQLDDKTNELLVRNAQKTATQSVAIAKMASGSSIQIEKLKQSYDTIMKGIDETRAIQSQNAEERKKNSLELERMKQSMQRQGIS